MDATLARQEKVMAEFGSMQAPGDEGVPLGAQAAGAKPSGGDGAGGTAVSPDEVEAKRFHIAVRGYDVEEVNGFLASVAESYRAALATAESRGAAATPDNLYEQVGNEVGVVLDSARRAAARLLEEAEEEVATLRAQARDEAEQAARLRVEAEQEIESLLNDARQVAETTEVQMRQAREKLQLSQAEVGDERRSLRAAVEECTATVSDARRDVEELRLGLTTLLTNVAVRMEELMARLEGTGHLLAKTEGRTTE